MNLFNRHRARKLAVQAIYQWQITNDAVDYIVPQFLSAANPKKIDLEYFIALVNGVTLHATELDQYMLPFLDRKVNELDVVELAVLRLALYELVHCPELPYKVIIDEALKLVKTFGAVESFKYVNGLLDKVAKKLPQRREEEGMNYSKKDDEL